MFGFSKGYGLAGLRLGLLIAPSVGICQTLLHLAHADETAYGVSALSQIAGLAAYESAGGWLERFVAHLLCQRDYAVERLNQMGNVTCHTPEGTYVLFPDVSAFGIDSEHMANELVNQHRVAVVPVHQHSSVPAPLGSFVSASRPPGRSSPRVSTGLKEASQRWLHIEGHE